MKTSVMWASGRGAFPEDMLRYDKCYPADGDLGRDSLTEPRSVRMVQHHPSSEEPRWTPDRWNSFLWALTEDRMYD